MSAIGEATTATSPVTNHVAFEIPPVDPATLAWAEFWYPIAWKGLIWAGGLTAVGACATIAFLLLQWRTTSIREDQSEWRTATLETQTAQAKASLGIAQADIVKANAQIATAQERTAEFDARTKEAELKLEQLRERVRQRHIKGDQFLKILEGKPKASVEILFIRDDGEAFQLALEIRDWLKRATWDVEEPRPITTNDLNPRFATSLPSTMAAGGQPQGVSLFLRVVSNEEIDREIEKNPLDPSEPMDTPRKALNRALLDSLGAISGGMSGEVGRHGVLRVIVGPKPAPLN
jgi:hypothetical protein